MPQVGFAMRKVNVTEFRQHLPGYLKQVRQGEPIQITQHGKVVARLVPEQETTDEARTRLKRWRRTARIGDVIRPLDDAWEADRGRL